MAAFLVGLRRVLIMPGDFDFMWIYVAWRKNAEM
jgi:hypothetical protein